VANASFADGARVQSLIHSIPRRADSWSCGNVIPSTSGEREPLDDPLVLSQRDGRAPQPPQATANAWEPLGANPPAAFLFLDQISALGFSWLRASAAR
jgi:hypothetical protein